MKKFSLLTLVWLINLCALSQNEKIVTEKLKIKTGDSVEVNALNATSKEVMNANSLQGKLYANQALKLAEKLKYTHGVATSYSNIGYFYLLQNNYDSALYYFNKGILTTLETKYIAINSELLNRKAAVFYYKGITDSSLS